MLTSSLARIDKSLDQGIAISNYSDPTTAFREVVGGDGLNDSVQATSVGGHIPIIGFMAGQTTALNLMPVIFRQSKIQGIAVGHRRAFGDMNQVLEKTGVSPVIDKVYGLDEAIAAYEHLAKGAFGKIVIKI